MKLNEINSAAKNQVPASQLARLRRGEPEEGDGETSTDQQLSALYREKNNLKKSLVQVNKKIMQRKAHLAVRA